LLFLKDEENARSTMADVLNLSLDYSIHFTESHTEGPMKKSLFMLSGIQVTVKGNTVFKKSDVLDENSPQTAFQF